MNGNGPGNTREKMTPEMEEWGLQQGNNMVFHYGTGQFLTFMSLWPEFLQQQESSLFENKTIMALKAASTKVTRILIGKLHPIGGGCVTLSHELYRRWREKFPDLNEVGFYADYRSKTLKHISFGGFRPCFLHEVGRQIPPPLVPNGEEVKTLGKKYTLKQIEGQNAICLVVDKDPTSMVYRQNMVFLDNLADMFMMDFLQIYNSNPQTELKLTFYIRAKEKVRKLELIFANWHPKCEDVPTLRICSPTSNWQPKPDSIELSDFLVYDGKHDDIFLSINDLTGRSNEDTELLKAVSDFAGVVFSTRAVGNQAV